MSLSSAVTEAMIGVQTTEECHINDSFFESQNDPDYTLKNLECQQDPNDTEQTFLKTINITDTPFKGDNRSRLQPEECQSYSSSPTICPDGTIQSAQSATSDQTRFITILDTALFNLPKDDYINKILCETRSCDEKLVGYRNELAARVKRYDNAPTGVLKDRRKSHKKSVVEKYAHDCFTMTQFLRKNASDISFLFKPNTYSSNISQESPLPNINSIAQQDISMLKNCFAGLQADVHLLKTKSDELESSLNNLSDKLETNMNSMKSVLTSCATSLKECIDNCEDEEFSLSDTLKSVATKLNHLESNRVETMLELESLKKDTNENALNISNIRDIDEQRKHQLKFKLDDLSERVEKYKNDVAASLKETAETTSKQIDSRIRQVETKVSKSPASNSSASNSTDILLKTLTTQLCDKFDKMSDSVNKTMQSALAYRQNMWTYNTPYPQTNPNNSDSSPNLDCQHISKTGVIKDTGARNSNSSINSTLETSPPLPSLSADRTQSQARGTRPVQISPEVINISGSPEKRPTEAKSSAVSSRFRGVIRKQAVSFFLTGIDLDSDQEGLELFLESIGVEFKTAKFLYTRRQDCKSAQIVVSESQSDILENPDTWPDGIVCRRWLQRSEYRRRTYGPRNETNGEID